MEKNLVCSFPRFFIHFLLKCSNQFFGIIVSLVFQFFLIPLIDSVYGILEGIDIHISILCNGYTIFILPAAHDLVVSGTVDLTFVVSSQFSALVDDFLLFRCQTVIDVAIDTEEQTIIVCIPQGTVRLYFLYTGCIAGDNTLMCVARSVDEGLVLMEKIRKMIV